MIRYRLKTAGGPVTVSLAATRPDENAPIVLEGSDAAVDSARRDVERSTGLHGHTLADATSPVDLRAAMAQAPLSAYRPKLLEGEAILVGERDPIPEGSLG